MENNFSIIISTCDKFSDLWDAPHSKLPAKVPTTEYP